MLSSWVLLGMFTSEAVGTMFDFGSAVARVEARRNAGEESRDPKLIADRMVTC